MTHRLAVTVWYEDTDLSGMVYHANYLKFIERGRSDWVAKLGVDQAALAAEGTVFAVARIVADFRAPARLGDVLEVHTRVAGHTAARLVLAQRVLRDATVLFEAEVTLAMLGPGGRPRRLPAAIRSAAGP